MNRWLPAMLVTLAAVGSGGCVGDCKLAGSPAGQPLGFMTQYAADVCLGPSGATGVAVAITTPDGNLGVGAAGLSDAAAGAELSTDGAFRVGPVSELFASALVVRLVDDGRIDLDALLVDRVPTGATAEPLAIRDLLAHRSGLKDYTKIAAIDLEAASTPAELITAVVDKGLAFTPGDKHALSASNYLALGMYVEALLGMPWGQALHQELLDPFGLGATFVDGYDDLPDSLAKGHNASGKDITGRLHPANAHAALGIVSNTTDVERLVRLLFEDETFLSEQSRLELRFPAEAAAGDTGFGFGVEIARLDGEEVWQRNGVHPGGYGGAVSFRPDLGVVGVALITGKPSNPSMVSELGLAYGIRTVDQPDGE
jgi:D-alanyl-D-alanine carboxypeptidase